MLQAIWCIHGETELHTKWVWYVVYFRKLDDGSFIYQLLYVDDMIIATKSISKIKRLKSQLSNEFEMKDLGATKKILDLEILKKRKLGILNLRKNEYLEKVLECIRI